MDQRPAPPFVKEDSNTNSASPLCLPSSVANNCEQSGQNRMTRIYSLYAASKLYSKLSGDDESEPHIQRSLSTLVSAFRLYGCRNVCVAFNGGKDATIVLYLTLAALSRHISHLKESSIESDSTLLHCLYLEGGNAEDNFEEVDSFVRETVDPNPLLEGVSVSLGIRDGIEQFVRERKSTCAFIMGTRRVDPHGASMERFEPSSLNWPAFMRVNPILDWRYRDVWHFLRKFRIPYCSLYDRGYTSIGSTATTHPNPALRRMCNGTVSYDPAWKLEDENLERAGRSKKPS